MVTSGSDVNQGIESMRDDEIDSAINRLKENISILSSNLKDKGARIIHHLKSLEVEQSRRKERRSSSVQKDKTNLEAFKHTISSCLSMEGSPDGVRHEKNQSTDGSESSFGTLFIRKMEDSACIEENSFQKELSIVSSSKRLIKRRNECLAPRPRRKCSSLSGGFPQQSAIRSVSEPDLVQDNGDLLEQKNRIKTGSKKNKSPTVVLVDEDESTEELVSLETIPDSVQNVKIYYPSRDDTESVEICYTDTSCLAPEELLTSAIMNFYIRYLQRHGSPLDNSLCNYHFFNTFFYEKLKQALSHQGRDRLLFFTKFRRWWKGVEIFQKAYVLIPIHEECHWSLVIICIPDKDDESGPIILHLDSLDFHCSSSVFENIKRYLISEWEFINRDVAPADVPIADRIWKLLPRRIEVKRISVPQQKNVYDCGLFVLFFMERFMEEAPERLKKKDLSMFGRKWFEPKQASMLRLKIRALVMDQFTKSSMESTSFHEDK